MLKNYFKIAIRSIIKQKFHSVVNIFGLTVGLTSVMLISLYVIDELSFDKFHENHEDIYRVVENQYYTGQPVFPVAVTPAPLAPFLKENFSQVTNSTRVALTYDRFKSDDLSFVEEGAYVDKDFFEIFSFKLVKGDKTTLFDDIKSVVINQDLAKKYFNTEDPIGKFLNVDNEEMLVTGVYEKMPDNSHLKLDYLLSMEYVISVVDGYENWSNNRLYTYIKVSEGHSFNDLNEQVKDILKDNVDEGDGNATADLYLQPLADIHLGRVNFTADIDRKGSQDYVNIFSIVAIFILLIACINFMNLSTARSEKRAKEVGLRKTIGATRNQLIFQFLGESVLMSCVAVIFAVLFTDLLLPYFNQLADKNLEISTFTSGSSLQLGVIISLCALITGILAGSYPALFLSSFQPVRVLKSQNTGGGKLLRKILVVIQFSISIVLIIGTLTISNQLDFILAKDLGINKEQVIYSKAVSNNHKVFRQKLLDLPTIKMVTRSNQHPAYVLNSTSGLSWDGANPDETILIHNVNVDPDYLETLEIELLEGRNFSYDNPGDSNQTVLINETAAKLMGFKEPVGSNIYAGDFKLPVIGVVKDFNFKSVHDEIEPLVIFYNPSAMYRTMIKINGSNVKNTVAEIENVWKELNPGASFDYHFLDDDYNKLYASEQRTSKLFSYFSALAIIISCLGLFGLASYVAEQRTKEISIRKVLGAPLHKLFILVSKDFTILVIIAFLISVPVGWYFMDQWLSGFAYRVNLSPMVFILSGAMALLIAIVTVSFQSLNAATSNPVKSLRSE